MGDLAQARSYWAGLMPVLGFEPYLDRDDEFAYRPAAGKRGTSLFFYPSVHAPQEWPQYPPPYFASFWLDPLGFMIEAVCHQDR